MGGMGVSAPARRWGKSLQMSHLSPTPGTGAPPDSHLTPSQIAPQGPFYMAKTPSSTFRGCHTGPGPAALPGTSSLRAAASPTAHLRPPPPPPPRPRQGQITAAAPGSAPVPAARQAAQVCRVTPVVFRRAEDKIQLMISREARAYYEYVPCCSPR